MYAKYFGLKELPFSISPNPRYLFMSRRHKEALAHLIYGISHGGGFVLLTGEVGTGKTTVSRSLLRQLPQNADVAYILNASLSEEELLATICQDLGIKDVDDDSSLKALTDRLHRYLLDNYAKGRTTLLIIDEAQNLQFSVLEQIRMLTNLETDERKLLQIVLIGQPELNELLGQQRLRQLSQRITARFHIEPLDLAETESYIRHRMMVAGLPANQSIFNRGAIKKIYTASKGIPRIINVICDRALLGAYTNNLSDVDNAVAQSAIKEALGHRKEEAQSQWVKWAGLGVGAAAMLVIAVYVGGVLFGGEPKGVKSKVTSNSEFSADTLIADSTVAPAMPVSELSPVSLLPLDRGQAINRLQQYMGVSGQSLDGGCEELSIFGAACYDMELNSWSALVELNRPAMIGVAGSSQYLPVVSMSHGNAVLLDEKGRYEVPIFELGELWDGSVVLLWRPPASFEGPVELGSRSEFVGWVAQFFAQIDNQLEPLADRIFNPALKKRVAIFQRQNGLEEDGIVGLKTVLKMNDFLNTDFSLESGE